jgi:hypothetical protein
VSRAEELQAEVTRLTGELAAAQAALLDERFAGIPVRPAGQDVLVKRVLFGDIRWWPARIEYAHRTYRPGTDAEPRERHIVSYSVYHRQADGSYGGTSAGYYEHEVTDAPAQEAP